MRLDQACRNVVCGVCGVHVTHIINPSIHTACAPQFLWNKGVVQAKHTHTSIEDHTISKLVNMLTMGKGWCPRDEADQVGLGCLLKSSHGEALEKQVCILGDCVNQTLKRKLPDEEVGVVCFLR